MASDDVSGPTIPPGYVRVRAYGETQAKRLKEITGGAATYVPLIDCYRIECRGTVLGDVDVYYPAEYGEQARAHVVGMFDADTVMAVLYGARDVRA